MTWLCRLIKHHERAAYETAGWTVTPFLHGAHHQSYGLLAVKACEDGEGPD